MKLVFVELPPFARHRGKYLDDGEFADLQQLLLLKPDAGVVISGTGGLRKLRFHHSKRDKGKRGGLRIIYFWLKPHRQIWFFTIYAKGETNDLTPTEKKALRKLLERELKLREKIQ